jgi:hypothetical protein
MEEDLYPNTENLEIFRTTFHRWHDRFLTHTVRGLQNGTSTRDRSGTVVRRARDRIITMATNHADL